MKLGFLKPKVIAVQEQKMEDLYRLFKCRKDQPIMAENLQNVLLIIAGERNTAIEIPDDDTKHATWYESGAYDDDMGLFYVRSGSHMKIQSHFKPLWMNRMQTQ